MTTKPIDKVRHFLSLGIQQAQTTEEFLLLANKAYRNGLLFNIYCDALYEVVKKLDISKFYSRKHKHERFILRLKFMEEIQKVSSLCVPDDSELGREFLYHNIGFVSKTPKDALKDENNHARPQKMKIIYTPMGGQNKKY